MPLTEIAPPSDTSSWTEPVQGIVYVDNFFPHDDSLGTDGPSQPSYGRLRIRRLRNCTGDPSDSRHKNPGARLTLSPARNLLAVYPQPHFTIDRANVVVIPLAGALAQVFAGEAA